MISATFEVSPMPNQTTNSGTRAMNGMVRTICSGASYDPLGRDRQARDDAEHQSGRRRR